jgi:Cu(I)/Ag(I) efflux system membrane fusion protein
MNPSEEAVIHLDEARSSVASIQTTPVETRAVQRKVDLFGEIAFIPDHHVAFTWYYSGRIEKILIDFNSNEVKAGEPLFVVYSEEAVADQRAYLEVLRQRWQSTFYQRQIYDAELTSIAERLYRIGMTPEDLKNLEKNGRVQAEFIIRAPLTGSIMGSLPSVGESFATEKELFHLAALDEVWFVADVYEQDLGALKLGQQIAIKCPAHPDQTFKGRLVFIDRQVDPQKRTVMARFLVSNPNHLLIPQLSATGVLQLGTQKSLLAIPAAAVIDTGKRQLVYVETTPHTYELRPVTIGPEGEISNEGSTRWVPVIKGLTAGEHVVTSGAFLIDAEAQMQGLPASEGEAPSAMQGDHKP